MHIIITQHALIYSLNYHGKKYFEYQETKPSNKLVRAIFLGFHCVALSIVYTFHPTTFKQKKQEYTSSIPSYSQFSVQLQPGTSTQMTFLFLNYSSLDVFWPSLLFPIGVQLTTVRLSLLCSSPSTCFIHLHLLVLMISVMQSRLLAGGNFNSEYDIRPPYWQNSPQVPVVETF